ncbi:MAG: 50S ribosomal protein L11 methyltransferase [Ahrensia sp.]|nr:50S ribosomal protein L11 methyltransferase [Ahrensia sp.]
MSQCRLYLTARKPEANHIASILDPLLEDEGIPTALFESDEAAGEWCYSVYVSVDDRDIWVDRLLEMLGGDGFGLAFETERLDDDVDWISATLADLAPVRAGRFLVHGSHDRAFARSAPVAVEIDAGQAFGTGHHGTTAGCLDLIETVLRRCRPAFVMDIGTGSGVLAIAVAKAARVPVLATDIDPVSTRTAKQNARNNAVSSHISFETSVGFRHHVFREAPAARLIIANILARPLEGLAASMRRHAETGADIVLSGLLPHQGNRIVATYRQHGFDFQRRHIRDGWLSLLLRAR